MYRGKHMVERTGNMKRRGFTLLELLTVIAIMAVMMGATTAAYFGLGRGARLRGAVSTLRSSLSLTRQQAILKGQTLTLEFREVSSGSDTYQYEVWYYSDTDSTEDHQVGQTGYLPRGISLSPVPRDLEFYPTGGAGADAPVLLTLAEIGAAGTTVTLTVYPLTGLMKVDY